MLDIRLGAADTRRFAALTQQGCGLPSPQDQLAIIVSGQVIAHPAVTGPISSGKARIAGFTTRTQTERLLLPLRSS